jgi:hypothetical protein
MTKKVTAYIDYLRVVLGESEDPDWVLRQYDQFITGPVGAAREQQIHPAQV